MRSLKLAVCAVALCSVQAPAQVAGVQVETRAQDTMVFISHEMGVTEAGNAVVSGAPFSAETVTEFRQTLGDGNVIERTSRGAIYRDSEGRTRREQPLGAGATAAGDAPKQIIIIRDPVAGVSWTLNPEEKVAIKFAVRGDAFPGPASGPVWVGESQGPMQVRSRQRIEHVPGSGGPTQRTAVRQVEVIRHDSAQPKNEDLGTQMINGVLAEGVRFTTTLPAGAIGNTRPIETVTERWFSPQLQTVVRTRSSDPRTGDYSFELTNIRHGEPSPSLFQPPPDYEVREASAIRAVPGTALSAPRGRGVRQSAQPRE